MIPNNNNSRGFSTSQLTAMSACGVIAHLSVPGSNEVKSLAAATMVVLAGASCSKDNLLLRGTVSSIAGLAAGANMPEGCPNSVRSIITIVSSISFFASLSPKGEESFRARARTAAHPVTVVPVPVFSTGAQPRREPVGLATTPIPVAASQARVNPFREPAREPVGREPLESDRVSQPATTASRTGLRHPVGQG